MSFILNEIHEVYAYVTRRRGAKVELLLCRRNSAPEGVHVPQGKVEALESGAEAALRHVQAETGLEEIERISMLTADRWRRDSAQPWRIRCFYILECEETRPRWQQVVMGSREDHGELMDCFWTPLPLEQTSESPLMYLQELQRWLQG